MRKTVFLTGVVLLLGLAPVGCNSDVSDGQVVMKVRLAGLAGDEESALRSAARVVAAERVALPGAGEELVVELVEDAPTAMRAIQKLTPGAKFRVIALKYSDKTLVDYEDYLADDPSDYVPIVVPDKTVKYDFICYSYNSTSYLPPATDYVVGQVLPASATLSAGEGTNTLYYCSLRNQTPTESSLGGIVLTKQLSTIRLRLDVSVESRTITAVPGTITFGPLGVPEGTLAPATADIPTPTVAAAAQSFTWPSSVNAAVATSGAVSILPQAASNLTLTIPLNAITLTSGPSPTTASSSVLSNVTIGGGKHYTVQIGIKRAPRWAGSNIYWDPTLDGGNGALTFKEYGHIGDENYYQGVHFKWGSLVGASPVSGDFQNGTNNQPATGTRIYVYHNGQWKATNVTTAYRASYPGFTAATRTGIPYNTTATGSLTEDNLGSTFVDNKGDICRYLSDEGLKVVAGKYRMPRGEEFGPYYNSAWTNVAYLYTQDVLKDICWAVGPDDDDFVAYDSDDETGRKLYGYPPGSRHGGYATFYSGTVPAGGHRNGSGLADAGTMGYLWSSSAYDSNYATFVRIQETMVSLISSTSSTKAAGRPVKCLLQE